jgi:putative membrane protein
MMHSMGSGGLAWIALTVWLVVTGVAAWVAVRLVRGPRRPPTPTPPSPLDLLERRFAAGEMTRDDFDEARGRLREHQLDI